MANIKNFFNKKSGKFLDSATQRSVGSTVESGDYLKSNVKDKKRFIPHVDFSTASNFAIYGSAEKYYEDSYNYILEQYPKDFKISIFDNIILNCFRCYCVNSWTPIF